MNEKKGQVHNIANCEEWPSMESLIGFAPQDSSNSDIALTGRHFC